ncbi:MAG TPA: metal-dependent hydrolase [Pseudolysinimonas sp.]|nr:metal-dependent hydrolase [Pseudolysinimonas sp.]
MTLPTTGTVVTYPLGALTSESRVLHIEPLDDGRVAVLLDRTSCHPVDAGWPDQPADRGVLDAGDVTIDILDAVVGATDGAALYLGGEIPVRKGTDGWAFVVAHLVGEDAGLTEGDSVTVEVDASYRAALSAGHSACHLAALALNAALAGAWSKDARVDSLGVPDFDGAANETSTILERGARDTYRIGKSLRKSGFDPAALDDPDAVAALVNATLASWSGVIRIERDGELLTDRRYWVADLPGGEARIACGGTHVGSVAELGAVTVQLTTEQLEGALGVTMLTSC